MTPKAPYADSLRPNVLFITMDQFRGDCLSAARHEIVCTPNLDLLAAQGVRLAKHYSQAAPCGPGRASLYTGMYQMNHRVVSNGSPLDRRHDNVALMARRAGYSPTMFGYTDQAIDPRDAAGPDDPRLSTYTGVLPGFDCVLDLSDDSPLFPEWLESLGYGTSEQGSLATYGMALTTENERPASHSSTAYLTNEAVSWIAEQKAPWFAHLSYLRPHPPFVAAGEYATMFDPATMPTPIAATSTPHPMHQEYLDHKHRRSPADRAAMAHLQTQYFGMIAELDFHLGRLWQSLMDQGLWHNTVIVVTADHGEQMGDHGVMQKLGWFEESYHIPGIVRTPFHAATHGSIVDRFTENIDLFPTLCEALGQPVPAQCDGMPLTPFLLGETPPWWRTSAHWEFDWRFRRIGIDEAIWPWDRDLEMHHLAVLRRDDLAYVQFGDGSWMCFDIATDPTWRTLVTDASVVLSMAQEMLVWRSRHAERTFTDMLTFQGGIGRVPPAHAFG